MSTTLIGELLEKHAQLEGADAAAAAIDEELAHLQALDAKFEAAETEAEKAAIEEERLSSKEKLALRKRRLLLQKDPSYRKAVAKVNQLNKGLERPKFSVQRDEETGDWVAAKIDLELAKKARQAAKTRAK